MLLLVESVTWASDQPVIAVLVGLVGLITGAELLVRGAVWIALTLGMSRMAVGLTLVSIGTSLPELLVTLTAADDHADLAMGNVMGSNIANILLIVGVTASIRAIHLNTKWFELIFMMLLTGLLCLPFFGEELARWQAAIFLTVLVVFVGQLLARERREHKSHTADDAPRAPATRISWLIHTMMLSGGFIILAYSAEWLVEGAVVVARDLGMSPNVIGLTVIAIGTSMPELATSAVAAMRGQPEICIGNVIGSNIFNVGAVLGGAGLLKPFEFEPQLLDLVVTVIATLVLVTALRGAKRVPRLLGFSMVIAYASFLTLKVMIDKSGAS